MTEEIKKEQQDEKSEARVTEKKEKKKPKKESEAEQLKQQLSEKEDLLKRTAAEFDNYKKRTEREKAGVSEFARAGVIKKLLPIIDNIDRASAAEQGSAEYIKGIEMIIKQFVSLKASLEIEAIANEGDEFNPQLHDAVMHIEDDSLGENVIAEVLQQGYRLGETVIRPAMVKVAN